MLINALINLEATRWFIDIEHILSTNLQTHLPRAVPVYNVDGTLNKTRYIIDLLVQYEDHSEHALFHVTSISQTTAMLRHMWLMEHNTEIDWHWQSLHD